MFVYVKYEIPNYLAGILGGLRTFSIRTLRIKTGEYILTIKPKTKETGKIK